MWNENCLYISCQCMDVCIVYLQFIITIIKVWPKERSCHGAWVAAKWNQTFMRHAKLQIIGALKIFGATGRRRSLAHETDGRRMAGDDASNRRFFSIKSCVQSSRSMRAHGGHPDHWSISRRRFCRGRLPVPGMAKPRAALGSGWPATMDVC